jgi:hypothetical protein
MVSSILFWFTTYILRFTPNGIAIADDDRLSEARPERMLGENEELMQAMGAVA